MEFMSFLVRRVAYSIFVLIGLSMLIFTIVRVMPGDPARLALGARATKEAVQELRDRMHLDESLPVQYYHWVKDVLQGKLGISLWTRREVSIDISRFLPATLELVLFAALIEAVFGILLGVIGTRYRNTWIDNTLRVGTYFAVATPAFVVAIFLSLIFGYMLKVLPIVGRLDPSVVAPPVRTGLITVDALISGNFTAFIDALKHIIMPAIALSLGGMAQDARITRSSMSDNLLKEYIAVERAQGIPPRVINLKYLLKPSLIAPVSVLGLDIASMLGNAFMVELVFGWPGLSQYGVEAALRKDLNAVTGVVLVIGLVYLTINILVDITVAYLDPRVRLR